MFKITTHQQNATLLRSNWMGIWEGGERETETEAEETETESERAYMECTICSPNLKTSPFLSKTGDTVE